MPHAKRRLHPTLINGIVARPVAFVSTISATGVENLAPFRHVLRCRWNVS